MIQSGHMHERDPWPAIARRYPGITSADGRVYFVDKAGLIDGLSCFGDHQGRRRCDCPYDPPAASDIAKVLGWIECRKLRPIVKATASSYSAKHWCERFVKEYIPNGAAIVAFHRAGFTQYVQPVSSGELNTTIAISRKSYKYLPEVMNGLRISRPSLNHMEVAS